MKIFISLAQVLFVALLLTSCGGRRSTTVVIIEPDPVQTYTINITRMSAVNPVGGSANLYVQVSNIYGSDSTNTTTESMVITDHGDDQPITFQLKDSAGVILEETFVLTDPDLLASESVDVFGPDPDNSFSFTFSIVLQTKKQ